MKRYIPALVLLSGVLFPMQTYAQDVRTERVPTEISGIASPTKRVRGAPGQLTVQRQECRSLPTADVRRHVVDAAVQEWAFFGFRMLAPGADDFAFDSGGGGRDFLGGDAVETEEATRVAASIAGYWATTSAGAGIVSSQNQSWNGPRGITSRWVAPWSAAFISWVMCEAGLGSTSQFQRAIAHHVYIDQAIRARDGAEPNAAYAAYDPGEAAVEPGDLLCASRRPAYRNLAERRRQMGEGARTHCDVVVKVDEARRQILAIGGNVRRAVSMKVFPAIRDNGKNWRPAPSADPERPRPMFAHLKLRAKSINPDAINTSPVIKAVACGSGLAEAKVC